MKTLDELSTAVATELSIEGEVFEQTHSLGVDRIKTEIDNACRFVGGLVNYGAVDFHSFVAGRHSACACDCDDCKKQLEFFDICIHKIVNTYIDEGCIVEAIEGSKLYVGTGEFKELVKKHNIRVAQEDIDPMQRFLKLLLNRIKDKNRDNDE